MKNFDIQVGDRITFIYKNEKKVELAGSSQLINQVKKAVEILKIERIGSNGWYTVYEKEKELLTEEERELLKVMIKNLCADIGYIKKSDEKVNLIKNNGEEIAQIVIKDIILEFKNLVKNKEYTLKELRIGGIDRKMEFVEIIKKVVKEKISEEIQNKIDEETEKFHRELTDRKDNYIAEIMNGIRIFSKRDELTLGMDYRIIFENVVRLEEKK